MSQKKEAFLVGQRLVYENTHVISLFMYFYNVTQGNYYKHLSIISLTDFFVLGGEEARSLIVPSTGEPSGRLTLGSLSTIMGPFPLHWKCVHISSPGHWGAHAGSRASGLFLRAAISHFLVVTLHRKCITLRLEVQQRACTCADSPGRCRKPHGPCYGVNLIGGMHRSHYAQVSLP